MTTHTSTFLRMAAVMLILGLVMGSAFALFGGAQAEETPGKWDWELLADYNEALFLEELKHGIFEGWSIEKKHAWQQRQLETGYQPKDIVHGLPGEAHITAEEALEAVAGAPNDLEGGASTEKLAKAYAIHYAFNVIDPERPVWEIIFELPGNEPYNRCERAVIDAATGEVLLPPEQIRSI